jgi:hypothetical protein
MKMESVSAAAWRILAQGRMAMVTAIAGLVLMTAFGSANAQSQAPFVVKALHNLSTINSISAEYTISHSATPGSLLRFRYMRSDDGVYFEDRTQSFSPQMESIGSGYKYHWRKLDGVVHAAVKELAAGKADFELRHCPEHLLGTRIFDALGMGLVDVLADPAIVVDAEDHKVTLSGFAPQRPGGALNVEAQFDPDHSFLPKIIQSTLTKPPVGGQRYLQRWEVLEYFKVQDGATGESRWFPRKAVLTQGVPNTITMEVMDAAVNTQIPAETFTPELPVGSQVYDATKEGGGGSYAVGVSGPELDTRVDAVARQHEVRASSITLVVLNVLLILALISVVVWRRLIVRKRATG